MQPSSTDDVVVSKHELLHAAEELSLEVAWLLGGREADCVNSQVVEVEFRGLGVTPEDLLEQQEEAAAGLVQGTVRPEVEEERSSQSSTGSRPGPPRPASVWSRSTVRFPGASACKVGTGTLPPEWRALSLPAGPPLPNWPPTDRGVS